MNYPLVSIIIPVRNEEKHIKACLEGVFSQTYPKDKMEILVVDGMSKDRTRDIIEKFKIQNSKFKIQLLDNPRGHRASSLNIGVRAAKGDVVLRIDARTIIDRDYVEKCIRTLLETGADNVGGVQAPFITEGSGLTQVAIGLAATHIFGVGDAQFRLGAKSGLVDSVYLGCFKKSVFDKVDLFDEDSPVISEDSDINYRIQKAGGKVYLNKDIKAYYIPRDNLRDLWRLYFRYGGARAGFFLKHRVLRWRQFVPVLFMFSIAVLPLSALIIYIFKGIFKDTFYSIIYSIILFSTAVLIGTYLIVSIFVSLSLALRRKDIRLFPRLMMIFPSMHFAWALGFFWRLLQRPKSGSYWGY